MNGRVNGLTTGIDNSYGMGLNLGESGTSGLSGG
jgi:hypothetical protein